MKNFGAQDVLRVRFPTRLSINKKPPQGRSLFIGAGNGVCTIYLLWSVFQYLSAFNNLSQMQLHHS